MKLFSEKVKPTLTNSTHNILQVEDYEEIFFGVYEIEINKTKYPVEKISEHNGNPVVSVPVTVKGVKSYYPFVLSRGNFEVLFNENNTDGKLNSEPLLIDDQIISEKIDYPQEVEDDVGYYNLVEKNKEILEQIEKAKKDAIYLASKIKRQKLQEANKEIALKKKALESMISDERAYLVNEFIDISNKIKAELIDENDNRFNEIKETIDNKINDLSDSFFESLKNDFESSSIQLESKIKELVSEIHKSLEPKIDNELKTIALEIVEKVDSIEQNLDKKLSDKADITLIENVEGELNSVAKANVELNDKINKGVNKALSRVGTVDKKVDELTIALSEEVENKISTAEENISRYYSEKINLLEKKTFDLTEETRKYIIDLVTESRDNLIAEIRQIKNEKPIEYIVESKGKKQSINSDDLVKDFDKKINSKIDNEVTRLRKYIAVYSGGGSVAQQFADGGIMNGNLTVMGTISASQYLGMPSTQTGSLTSEFIPNGSNKLTITGNLSVSDLYPVFFDELVEFPGLWYNRPYYISLTDTLQYCLYDPGWGWMLFGHANIYQPTWRGVEDTPTPDLVTTWEPLGDSVGIPSVSSSVNSPPIENGSYIGQLCRQNYGVQGLTEYVWWTWSGDKWILDDSSSYINSGGGGGGGVSAGTIAVSTAIFESISASQYLGIQAGSEYFQIGVGEPLRDPVETLGIQINDVNSVLLRTTDDYSGFPFYSTNGSQYTTLDRAGQRVYYNGIQWVMEIYGPGGEYVTTYFATELGGGGPSTPDDLSIWVDYPFINDVWLGPDPLFSPGTLFFIINYPNPVEIYMWSGVEFVKVTEATNTLDSVTTNGNTTTNSITVGDLTVTGSLSVVNTTPFYNKTLFKYNLEVGENNVITFPLQTSYDLIQTSFTLVFSTITSKNTLKFDCITTNGSVMDTGYAVMNLGDTLYTSISSVLSGGYLVLNIQATDISQLTIVGEAIYEPGISYEGSIMISEGDSIFISENSDIFVFEN